MGKTNDRVENAVKITVPVMTAEKFAVETGLSERTRDKSEGKDAGDKSGVVVNLMQKGHLPTTKLGRHRMVNVAVYTSECLSEE